MTNMPKGGGKAVVYGALDDSMRKISKTLLSGAGKKKKSSSEYQLLTK